jgi:threonine dehydrogenase-like Zn-dependent dehydrogenase
MWACISLSHSPNTYQVGLLATIVARTLGAKNLYAIDSNPSRLQTAEKHGAKQLNLNSDPKSHILSATNNRGADVVIEAVGHGDALRLAYPMEEVKAKVV